MTMKSTQMTTTMTTTSIWKSLRRCRRRPLISKRTKMMMKESKDTMMTSSRRARGRKLAVRAVCLVAIGIKRTAPVARMVKATAWQMATWAWTMKTRLMKMRSLTSQSKSSSRSLSRLSSKRGVQSVRSSLGRSSRRRLRDKLLSFYHQWACSMASKSSASTT